MLSKKQKREQGLVGVKKFIIDETGEEVYINFDETPVFTPEEWEKYNIGQPGMKPYSELTEEERRIFTEIDDDE